MKRVIWLFALAVFWLMPAFGLAELDSAIDLSDGPMEVTLPERATLVPGQTIDSYIVRWIPLEGISAYRIIGIQEIEVIRNRNAWRYWELAGGGRMGDGEIEDGEGKKHFVAAASFDNQFPSLDGTASEADFADLVNGLCQLRVDMTNPEDKNTVRWVVGYYIHFVIIPESGEPIVQTIALPFKIGC